MSNLIVDGFATYGVGPARSGITTYDVGAAMLAGAYAQLGFFTTSGGQSGGCDVYKGLPWDASDDSYWLGSRTGGSAGRYTAARRVLPSELQVVIFACRFGLSSLPTVENAVALCDFRSASNAILGTLYVGTTGALVFNYGAGSVTTSGPVVVAEKAHYIEIKIDMDVSTQHVEIHVDGAVVIDTDVPFTTVADIAQFGIVGSYFSGAGGQNLIYMTDLIVRDTNGSYNTDFMGDRRVATLMPNGDDPLAQGWTAHPIHCFGVGVARFTGGAIYAPNTPNTDIGADDFTIEGMWRFESLPEAANRSTLFGKWDETNNRRSYELYLGGPSLDSGALVFRTSTDGQNGTVATKLKWYWKPQTGQWYHIAVARESGVLRWFIDGVQIGVDVADTDTYYAGIARAAIGRAMNGTSTVAGTSLLGWQDEFRLTVGACRYTTDFSPPTDNFPRGGDDPDWDEVMWLSSWDNAAVADDGPNGMTLTSSGAAASVISPNDGDFAYLTINQPAPDDNTFIEASLVPATGILTFTGQPSASETVTVGTSDGTTPAVYTFVASLGAAFDVLIGGTLAESVDNLIAAINKEAGEGSLYGAGTVANYDVEAHLEPTGQVSVIALVPGNGGNSIASTTDVTGASWGDTTLDGGADIPGPSRFTFQRLPAGATIVDSVTFAGRQFKTDGGVAKTKTSFYGVSGGTADGAEYVVGTAPNLHFDTFEEDPDTNDALTPQSVRTMRIKINRTE